MRAGSGPGPGGGGWSPVRPSPPRGAAGLRGPEPRPGPRLHPPLAPRPAAAPTGPSRPPGPCERLPQVRAALGVHWGPQGRAGAAAQLRAWRPRSPRGPPSCVRRLPLLPPPRPSSDPVKARPAEENGLLSCKRLLPFILALGLTPCVCFSVALGLRMSPARVSLFSPCFPFFCRFLPVTNWPPCPGGAE